jgi:hypothetical protein
MATPISEIDFTQTMPPVSNPPPTNSSTNP